MLERRRRRLALCYAPWLLAAADTTLHPLFDVNLFTWLRSVLLHRDHPHFSSHSYAPSRSHVLYPPLPNSAQYAIPCSASGTYPLCRHAVLRPMLPKLTLPPSYHAIPHNHAHPTHPLRHAAYDLLSPTFPHICLMYLLSCSAHAHDLCYDHDPSTIECFSGFR